MKIRSAYAIFQACLSISDPWKCLSIYNGIPSMMRDELAHEYSKQKRNPLKDEAAEFFKSASNDQSEKYPAFIADDHQLSLAQILAKECDPWGEFIYSLIIGHSRQYIAVPGFAAETRKKCLKAANTICQIRNYHKLPVVRPKFAIFKRDRLLEVNTYLPDCGVDVMTFWPPHAVKFPNVKGMSALMALVPGVWEDWGRFFLANTHLGSFKAYFVAKRIDDKDEDETRHFGPLMEYFPVGLRTLQLYCPKKSRDVDMDLTVNFLKTTQLNSLTLFSCSFSQPGVYAFNEWLAKATALKTLAVLVTRIPKGRKRELLYAIAANKQIEYLSLKNLMLQNDNRVVIAKMIKESKKLKELDLGHNNIDDDTVHFIFQAMAEHPALRSLSLQNNRITAWGGRVIAQMIKTNTVLKELDVSNNFIADGAYEIGQALIENKKLQYVDLEDNRITGRGTISVLEGAHSSKSLELLKLKENTITKDDAEAVLSFFQDKNERSMTRISLPRIYALRKSPLRQKILAYFSEGSD